MAEGLRLRDAREDSVSALLLIIGGAGGLREGSPADFGVLSYTFQFNIIFAHWPELVHGALLSLLLALAGFWIGAPFAFSSGRSRKHAGGGAFQVQPLDLGKL